MSKSTILKVILLGTLLSNILLIISGIKLLDIAQNLGYSGIIVGFVTIISLFIYIMFGGLEETT